MRNSSNFGTFLDNMFAKELSINCSANDANERDTYQTGFKCCGWNEPNDYLNNTMESLHAPLSCCSVSGNCNGTSKEYLFKDGCKGKITEALKTVIQVACAILVTFSMFNLLSITLSFVLARQIRIGYQYTS